MKLVNKATFKVIQQLFPQAMTHRIRVKDGEIQPCSICTRMNQFEKDLPLHLFSLQETHSALFDEDLSDMIETKGTFYLVHNDDVRNIHEISNLIRKKCPLGKNVSQKACQMLKEKLISEYFQSNSSQMNTHGDKKLYCRWSLHSLICPLGTTHVSS